MSGPENACFGESQNVLIDGPEFARTGGSLRGTIPVAGLERLADLLSARSGVLAWECVGRQDRDGRGRIRLRVSGRLEMTCQRCLGALLWSCEVDTEYLLVGEGAPWPEDDLENAECDAIPASAGMSLWSMVEDEVLLALPIAPRHQDCRLPGPDGNKEATSPFAALAGWKKH